MRLEREYALAKERLDRETEALEFRTDALTAATTTATANVATASSPAVAAHSAAKTKATLAMMDDARAKLEVVADRAQDLLTRFRGGAINERATMRELKDLLEGANSGGCDVAGLCKMVGALDFTGVVTSGTTATATAQVEVKKTVRKRKVQDVKAEEQKAVEDRVQAGGRAKHAVMGAVGEVKGKLEQEHETQQA